MSSVTDLKKSSAAEPVREDYGFPFRIVRSAKRRTISIEIRSAQVAIRAPLAVPESVLLDFLQQKAAWVRQKIAEQTQQLAQRVEPVVRVCGQGTELAFMDEQLRLVIGRGATAAVHRLEGQLHLILSTRSRAPDAQQIRQLLARWYQQQALKVLTEKTHRLCAQMGLRCQAVTVKHTRSKWGHCTSRGAIQYNWNILLAPEGIVDYLVAHEVCHLRHPNHSRDFWALVASVCPSFVADRAWLKATGAQLSL